MKIKLKEGSKEKEVSKEELKTLQEDHKVKLTLNEKESSEDTKVYDKKSLLTE